MSIAFENGFLPETIWNHPNNAELKRKRKDLNILMPGDIVFVPDLRVKEVSEPTDQVHKFKYKTAAAKLNLQLLNDGEPIENEPFELTVDGEIIKGTTDGDGKIMVSIAPNAKNGQLIVGTGTEQIKYDLNLGTLPPIGKVSGVKRRLYNLGYKVGSFDENITPDLEDAIAAFEFDNQLTETGQLSETNRAKILEAYGR